MRKSLRFLLIGATFLGGGILAFGPTSFSTEPAPAVSIALPQASMDLTDLDLRDEFNRPIRSLTDRTRMERLFTAGLNRLLLMNMTPRRRLVLSMLADTWRGATEWFRRKAFQAFSGIKSWFQERKTKIFRLFEVRGRRWIPERPAEWADRGPSGNRFLYLITSIISSTQLLR